MNRPECARSRYHSSKALTALLVLLSATCGDETAPESGTLEVAITTVGGDLDVNGYQLNINGKSQGPVGISSLIRLNPWPTGSHYLALLNLDENCELSHEPGAVTVRAGETTRAEFEVLCHPTGVRVVVRTEGLDLDPDGYTVDVGPYILRTASANGSVTASRVQPGVYAVQVRELAPNCRPSGDFVQQVQVTSRQVVETGFDFFCTAITGIVEVTVRTTGLDPDPNGYLVQVGSALAVEVAATGSVRVHQVPAGSHSVGLTGLTPNCSLPAGGSPKTVEVTAAGFKRDTIRTEFEVSCVVAEKIGFVQGGLISLVFLDGTNWYSPGLTRGTFDWSPDGTSIVYEGIHCDYQYPYYDDTCTDLGLLVTNVPFGSGYTLTTQPSDRDPSWSPDGSHIAFSRGGILYVMSPPVGTAQGLNLPVRSATEPAWKPGGGRLAFTCEIDVGNQDICAVNRDGTGFVRLTSRPERDKEPAWHPNGSRIAFSTLANGVWTVMHMAPDGTDLIPLVAGESPAWSPTGDRLALVRNAAQLGIVNADGTGFRVIVTGPARAPAWRP